MRHPYELGGVAFVANMLISQVVPFVGLWMWEDGRGGDFEGRVGVFLAGCLCMWAIFNAVFFFTIDLSFLNTFFGTKTAPEYTCERFLTSKEDYQKWAAAFESRMDWKRPIEGEVKVWVKGNIRRWRAEGEDWFEVELIPDDFLPADVFVAEGGAMRLRKRMSMNHDSERGQKRTHSGRKISLRVLPEPTAECVSN